MLLDRHKVKFWQKIVFSVMALLMAGFLITIPISRASGCGGSSSGSVSDQLKQELKTYKAAVAKDPANATAWSNLGDVYLSSVRGQLQQGATLTDQQKATINNAAAAYLKASKLLQKQKGQAAKTSRVEVLQNLAAAYDTLGDYGRETSVYNQLTGLQPKNADFFFALGNVAIKAGDTTGALLAFQRFVDLAPNDPLTPDVKAWTQKNAPKGTPAPTSTKGTGQ